MIGIYLAVKSVHLAWWRYSENGITVESLPLSLSQARHARVDGSTVGKIMFEKLKRSICRGDEWLPQRERATHSSHRRVIYIQDIVRRRRVSARPALSRVWGLDAARATPANVPIILCKWKRPRTSQFVQTDCFQRKFNSNLSERRRAHIMKGA